MMWIVAICGLMLFVSAILVLVRIERGPSVLDRMVGVDVMTSILLGALALLAAVTRRSDLLAVFVVVSVVGFLGSVALARIARREDPGKRRILTAEEEQAIDAAQEAADQAEVAAHDIDLEEAIEQVLDAQTGHTEESE
ncbi:MAG: monovalent cation/H+ antiporter complex subunit F [Ancrocorticia sp.]|jgi:multicomponent Na+:H+ antiporter subunit F|nr:monovalent cation/H+ antiporter complex subunit F [Ancrocorticia sp.]MCI1895876.1 monovalent cation/H+ antiporter complex subunit F [Ancrocorticia sp.]MCI1932535.1 monovalent cation/H+ antiporter complex subunit F [Ancrocorticia sp.]MCI1963713.1 monovalent cation/H+ antiporter complex subunit F [Ancrocorticia sp.]MCI2003046.1 monovalent cation/H+ antiporter complex subunit F [Ancrocorticia sp.]